MRSLSHWPVFLAIVGMPLWAASKDGDVKAADRFDASARWQRAALNREWAASTKSDRAEELMDQAKALRTTLPADAEERRRAFQRAGGLALSAAGLYGSACANYDKACENWNKVGDLRRKAEDEDSEARARNLAARSSGLASEACRNAAHAFEMAADSFSKPNGDELDKAAAAGEQAAAWWEKLAARE